MQKLFYFLTFYLLPIPFARLFVNGLIFLGLITKRQIVGPRNVQISIPSGCDHNCQFCITDIHGEGAAKNRNTLSFTEICKTIESAISICSLNIHLVSTGEPALYPKLQELIEFIYQKGRGRVQIKIVTNGTSLTKFDSSFIKERNLVFWLSLHAGDLEIWKGIHRPLVKADEKFMSLKSWLKKLNAEAPGRVTLHNVICNLNFRHLDTILDFAKETGCSNIFFGRLYKFPELQLTAEEERETLKHLQSLELKFQQEKIKTNIVNFQFVAISKDLALPPKDGQMAPPPTQALKSQDFYKNHNCYISWLFSPINDVGLVTSCGAGRAFGNVRDKKYAQILNEKAKAFFLESTQIKNRGTNVEGCRCSECPHIQMNAQASHYLKKLGF